MPQRVITDEEKQWVYRLHGEGLSRNQIARDTGLGAATVSRICSDAGLSFDRAKVQAATAARKVDLADRRQRVIERLYARQETLLANLEAVQEGARQWDTVMSGQGGAQRAAQLDFVPAPDERAISHSISSYAATAAKLEAVDAGDKAEEGKSLLTRLADRLGVTGPLDTPERAPAADA